MPTAHDYRNGATAFRQAASSAGTAEGSAWSIGTQHGIGEELGATVDQAFNAIATTVSSLGRGCDAVADECDRRVIVCEQYAEEVARWEQRYSSWLQRRSQWLQSLDGDGPSLINPGPSPMRPTPPFPWVEL